MNDYLTFDYGVKPKENINFESGLNREQIQKNPSILKKVIRYWEQTCTYIEMNVSETYYMGRNIEITQRKKMMELLEEVDRVVEGTEQSNVFNNPYNVAPILVEDLSKANHKLIHNYMYELTNQCKTYLCGKPIRVSYKNDNITDEVKEMVDDILYKYNNWVLYGQENIKNAIKYKWAWTRVHLDDEQKLLFDIVDSRECIPFYDKYGKLVLMIRYFTISEFDENGDIVRNKYVEVYDDRFKDTYKETKSGYEAKELDEVLIGKKQYFGDRETEDVEVIGWGAVPFVQWKYNDDNIDGLQPIKCFVDMIDLDISDLANNIDDIQDVIWILENYNGQNLVEFMRDLKVRKALNLGENGKAYPEKIDIPIEARMKLYEVCNKNIYKYGRGVDFTDRNNLGNATGVALKWSYGGLDEKADELQNHGQVALNNLFKLIFRYLYIVGLSNELYDSNDVEFIFDRTMIVNEKEKAETAIQASTLLSQKTALENHPYVADVEEELIRLSEEGEIVNDTRNISGESEYTIEQRDKEEEDILQDTDSRENEENNNRNNRNDI